MNIVFLGMMFCEESLNEAREKSIAGIQMATHVFQTNLLNGLTKCDDVNVTVYNIPPVGSYLLNYRKLFMRELLWGEKNKQIGFLNLPVIKHLQQEHILYKYLEEKIIKEKELNIIVYSLYEPFLKVISKLKNNYANVNACLIQTDAVLGREDMERCMTKKNIRTGNRLVSLAKNIDSFALLTKYLKETLEVGDRENRIIECICDDFQQESKVKSTSNNICLYTGVTEFVYGIKELVESFKRIPEAQLWICGKGDADEYLKECEEKYSNIKFFGFVDKEKVNDLRNQCDFLINPRQPSGTYTKYSFPSKTIEYMMSGKPVIMYKLEAIPDEYDQYLNYLTGTTSEQMGEELKKIFAKDYKELIETAKRARTYVKENKAAKKQAMQIVELLKKERK